MKKKGARILVIDDEIETVRLLKRIFTAHDFQVFTTTSALDPLKALVGHRPDLLLLGLDGPVIVNVPGVGYRFTCEQEFIAS